MKQPIERSVPQYQPLPGVLNPISIREFRGVNTLDPFSIGDSFFTDMSNMTVDDYPTVSVRPGYTALGSAIGTKVLGLGVWKDTELHAVFNDGTWRRWDGTSWVTLKSGLSTTADWSFTNFEGNLSGINLIGCNGVNGLHRYDGALTTFGNAPSTINYVTTYQNRLWGAHGKEIAASALDNPGEWNSFPGTESDSYGKTMEDTRGENVNMLSGSLSKLVIGMPNSMHELYGGVPSDFSTRLITEETGFANNKSAFIQDAVLRFIHKNGLYEYISGGISPNREYSDIVDKLVSVSTDSVAASDGKKFYFKVDNAILVYDIDTQTWSVWHGINAVCFAMFKGELYVGDSQGRVLRLGGATDAGIPITWRVVTKPFTNATAAQRSRWLRMWLMIELVTGSTATISLSETKDGNDWEQVYSLTGTGLHIERVIVPIRKFTLSHMLRIKIEGTGWAKLHEVTRQGRVISPYGGKT